MNDKPRKSEIHKNVEEYSSNNSNFFSIVISTFSTIFLAELGDKTQIATLMLSAQSGNPFIVFLGSSISLICSSLMAVLLGRWIATNMPREKFTLLAGALMISLSFWLALDGFIEFRDFI